MDEDDEVPDPWSYDLEEEDCDADISEDIEERGHDSEPQ